MKIAVSFLKIKANLKENIEKLNHTQADYFHFDIMDGFFVTNQTRPFNQDKQLAGFMKKPFDVHLMVKDVYQYVDCYAKLKPLWITFHLEVNDTDNIIDYIKAKGIKIGLSIKPNTDVKELLPYLDKIDLVLLMSVEPGQGGQKFLPATEARLHDLVKYRTEQNLDFLIQIDGGINQATMRYCQKADLVVVGSYITDNDNYEKQINNLLNY